MNFKNTAFTIVLALAFFNCSNDDDSPSTTIDPSLIAHYNFEGNANDISSYNNTGIISGPSLTLDSNEKENSAYYFDGNDDKISVPHDDIFSNLNEFTIIALVKTEEIKSQVIVRKSSGANGINLPPFGLSMSATNNILFSIGSNNGEDYNQVQFENYDIDAWYNIKGVLKDQVMYLYINNELIETKTIVGSVNPNISPLLIGTRLSLPSSTFKGTIDDIKIYNKAILIE
jgi:hypothetical protein